MTAKEIRASTRDRSSAARPSGSSEAESQPPVLHFADSPEPDPFNFMSSVKRKFQDQNRSENVEAGNAVDNLASVSMALSEGPLSVTSHSSSKKSVDKSKSRSIEKSIEKEQKKKTNNSSDSVPKQPSLDQMVISKKSKCKIHFVYISVI